MKLLMFAVYDSKAGAYLQPFFMRSVPEAIRAFTDTVSNPDTAFHRHGEDFTLFQVGEYDDQTGEVSPIRHNALGKAIEFQAVSPSTPSRDPVLPFPDATKAS